MAEIYLRRAQLQDLTAIMKIIDDAKELLKKNGSPQWQNGYPDQETFTQDIVMQTNWILINDNKVVATATLQLTPAHPDLQPGRERQPRGRPVRPLARGHDQPAPDAAEHTDRGQRCVV